MAENSKIEWCNHTFNPWEGCTKISEGCKNCYAEARANRFGTVKWGPTGQRRRTSAANWRKPLAWNKQAAKEGRRYRVFCASLADVFEEKPDQPEMDDWRRDLLQMIIDTPHLDWLLLTKRPENVCRIIERVTGFSDALMWFPQNVWIGTSVENQEQADKRIPELLRIPAAVRFLSMEPLLGKVLLDNGCNSWLTCTGSNREANGGECCESYAVMGECFHGIDWVIVGGESGPNARPMHPDLAREIRDQCVAAGVPFLFKQWGQHIHESQYYDMIEPIDPDRWIHIARNGFANVGKHIAGRLLDGRTWDEFPLAAAGGE